MKSISKIFLLLLLFIQIFSLFEKNNKIFEDNFYFRVSDIFNISSSSTNVSRITSIDKNTLAVQSIDNTNVNVQILSGSKFQNMLSQKSMTSVFQTKYSGQQMLFNLGEQIQKIPFSQSTINFNVKKDYGNVLITDDYILIPQQDKCGSLVKLNLKTNTTTSITLQSGQNCFTSSRYGYLKQVGNGKIGFAIFVQLYILNKTTLELIQKINVKYENSAYCCLSQFDSWFDQKTEESIISVPFMASRMIYQFNKKTGFYQKYSELQTQNDYNFRVTGPNEAFSYNSDNKKLRHWQTLENNLKTVSFNQTQWLGFRYSIAVSNDQTLFAVYRDHGSSSACDYYSINNDPKSNYSINLIFSINYSVDNDDFSKCLFTSDDKFLFFFTPNSEYFTSSLTIIDKDKDNKIQIKPNQNTKILDYGLFESKFDRFILLVQKNQTKGEQTVLLKRYLQIRKISQPQIVFKQLQIIDPLNENITQLYDYRLKSSFKWGLDFIISFKTSQSEYEDQCLSKLYSINNDQIIDKGQKSYFFSFYDTFLSQKLVITFQYSEKYLKIYSKDNLNELVYQININKFNFASKSFVIRYQNQKLIILTEQRTIISLDFSLKQKQNWYKGYIFRQHFFSTYGLQRRLLFFPMNEFVYLYTYSTVGTYEPVKAVYSVSKPNIDKQQNFTEESVNLTTYYYLKKNQYQQCDSFFFLNTKDKKLGKFLNCEPYSPAQYFSWEDRNTRKRSILQSSNGKYIFIYQSPSYDGVDYYKVEARQIQNLSNVIWERQLYTDTPGRTKFADFTKNNKLITITGSNVIVQNFIKPEISSNYGIQSIVEFDVSQTQAQGQNQKCIAFGGYHFSLQKYNVIVKQNNTQVQIYNKLFDNKIIKIKINMNCEQVALVTQHQNQFTIDVWRILDDKLIHTSTYDYEIKKVKFDSNNKLFAQVNNNIIVINLNVEELQTTQESASIYSQFEIQESIYQWEINKNGQLIAIQTSPFEIKIFNTVSNKIIGQHFIVPIKYSSTISSLSFTILDSPTLLIALFNGALFTLTTDQCPQTFINLNSFCICPINFVQFKGTCVCDANRTLKGNECICLDTYVEKNGKCRCSDTFLLKEGKCACDEKRIQLNGKCHCKNNFVDKGGQCICKTEGFYQEDSTCLECSFLCHSCVQDSFPCIKFAWSFYVIIGVASLLVIAVLILIIRICLKKKRKSLFSYKDKASQNEEQKVSESNLTKDLLTNSIQKSKQSDY